MHQVHLSNFLSWVVIKNKSSHPVFKYPYLTKSILAHTKLLLAYGAINGYKVEKDTKLTNNSTITVFLKYDREGIKPVFRQIKFFSRPGCYRYLPFKKIIPLMQTSPSTRSLFIFSTSAGVLTAHECVKKRIGGLLLYYVSI